MTTWRDQLHEWASSRWYDLEIIDDDTIPDLMYSGVVGVQTLYRRNGGIRWVTKKALIEEGQLKNVYPIYPDTPEGVKAYLREMTNIKDYEVERIYPCPDKPEHWAVDVVDDPDTPSITICFTGLSPVSVFSEYLTNFE